MPFRRRRLIGKFPVSLLFLPEKGTHLKKQGEQTDA
uniref:Uncharacterized protein n=1 Tax=Siphoviridae sp. ctx254 TaxID=2825737 RepID=A0A8S5TVR1_9CAUD|nr:MAG TPA: hypothetical protein [Siphoviridae sp. ctx254]